MPTQCPAVKRDGMTRFGAELIVDGASYDEAHERALALAAARGVPYVSAYDDDDVIAGNGEWLGRELREQHAWLSRVIVPVGGGGLVAGLLRALAGGDGGDGGGGGAPGGARVEIIGVQPRVNCAMHDSLAQNRALVDYRGGDTLCEGLEGATAQRTFAIARAHRLRDRARRRRRDARRRRLRLSRARLRRRAVGGGRPRRRAQPAACPTDEETVIVVTGGNIEPSLLERALALGRRQRSVRYSAPSTPMVVRNTSPGVTASANIAEPHHGTLSAMNAVSGSGSSATLRRCQLMVMRLSTIGADPSPTSISMR